MTVAPPAPRVPSLIARLRRLSAGDVALLGEAFVLLAMCSAAIRLLSFTRVGRMASARLRAATTQGSDDLPDRIAWAVRACARRAPWRAVCFQQGLAAQTMLRRRGVDSTLYFGAAPDEPKGLAAHVWVKVGERGVIGCEEADRFGILAVFPPRAAADRPPDRAGRFDAVRP